MDARIFLREMLGRTHGLVDGTIEGLTDEQLHWQPGGTGNPIAASYAHLVLGEDRFIQAVIQGREMLATSTWANQTGLSELPPVGPGWAEWARRVRMDLRQFRAYAHAVYDATERYLASAGPDELDRGVEHRVFGKQPVANLIGIMVIHISTHTGEIGAIKGLQGLKGLPF